MNPRLLNHSLPHHSLQRLLQQKCFPVNIANFLGTPNLTNICELVLLELVPLTPFVDALQTGT